MGARIVYTDRAKKDLKKLDQYTAARIKKAVNSLNFIPMQGDIKALSGTLKGMYRLRVGNYRAIFMVEENTITILSVKDRKEAYKA